MFSTNFAVNWRKSFALAFRDSYNISDVQPRFAKGEAGMRIYTVTCNGKPAAVVRAENSADAINIARELGESVGLGGMFVTREPNDGEMVSWLEHRSNHLLPEATPLAAVS
jgi:hypothetical protein